MSFLGGPECSTGSNPLAQFQKQTSADTSLQRDRLTARGAPQLNGFRSAAPLADDAAFQDFAQAAQQPHGPHMGDLLPNDSFHYEQQQHQHQHQRDSGGNWAGEFSPQAQFAREEFAQQQQQQHNGAFNPQDFARFRMESMSPAQRAQSPAYSQQQPQAASRMGMYGGGMGTFGMQRPMMYQSQMWGQQPQPQQQYEGKGKGRVQELSDTDWEKQFAELSTVDKEEDAVQLDREAEAAIEAELNAQDRSETGVEDLDSLLRGIRQEADANRDLLADQELTDRYGEEFDQWKDFDGMNHDFDGLRTDIDGYGMSPNLGAYMFEENNIFKEVPNAFEEGQKIMREGGNLSLAALAFEAAVQKQQDFVEAWVALGQAQAQNEKESPAIRALEQALKLDPNNLDALMGLAVSYTNEGYDTLAYRTLERWISIKYPQLGVQPRGLEEPEEMGFTERHVLHEKVTNHYLEAAQLHPEGGDVDVDVQVGLGVLFYGSEDYDKAVDCFTAALNSHQHGSMKKEGEEHLLWNRLGATLANSSRSEEAIEAYSRALELRPNFVRARYNLGVSCINLGVLEEAAGHLLGALSMHKVLESEGKAKAAELLRDGVGDDVDESAVEHLLQHNQSTNLYDTLKRVFTQMSRRDLANMVGPDMNLDALRSEFDF